MNQEWEIKKLNEISENLDSKRVPITKNIRSAGDVPYYGASGIVDYVDEYLFDEDLLCVSEDGANLLARTYPIAFSITGKTWVNNHAHVLKFENSTTQKFVELYLNSIKLDDFVSGMAQPKLNQTMLNKIPIPFPPLPDQQRIVTILEEAFEAINQAKENAEQNLKNAQELFESYLQSVFETKGEGWEEKTLGEVCELINRGISPKYIEKDGIVVLNQKCIRDHKINFELSRLHDSFSKKVSIEKIIRKGDVLVNSTGTGTLGRVAQVKNDLQNVTVDSHITIVRPKENMFFIPFFGWTLIFIEDEISKKGDGCGGQIELARNTLKNDFKICYPKSLAEQQTIVAKLDALSEQTKKLESIYQQKLADLEELKKSILHKAFNGEL